MRLYFFYLKKKLQFIEDTSWKCTDLMRGKKLIEPNR